MARPQTIQESRWVGRVLRDKWRIDGRIARGGMGTVFAATHKNNGSTAAIKILHPEFSRDADTRSRFLQEGYAANQVNHPGVVRILDDDVSEEGLAYLVMELLEGELLEQRRIRKGGRLPLAEVYDIAEQLLDVLAAAHAKDIVHRDVKPDNIFLTQQGRLKVLDFGFAQMKTGFRTEQTATGFLLGTPGFMAPEQAIGNRPLIDAQTDIWAVGATLFILLSGEPVHDGESAAEMLVAAANFPARSISTLEPGLPSKLRDAVDRALAFQKSDRWPDARSMQAALRNVPGRHPVAEPSADRSKWRQSVVDDGERRAVRGAPIEDATVMDQIVELESDELIESAEVTAYVHPADREPATVAVEGDGPTLAVRSPIGDVDAKVALPDLADFPPADNTVIMDSRPRPPGGFDAPRPSYPDAFGPARPPMPSYGAGGIVSGDRRPSSPDESAPWVSAPTAPRDFRPARPPVAGGGSRVLGFVLVAGITMVVVILTGLLVILGSD
ncbi:MAG: protein kinase [Labilithrix sp.]|nr:protein kinase [Labilithrix sp.]